MKTLINMEPNLPLAFYHNLNERLQRAYNILLYGIGEMMSEVSIPLHGPQELLTLYEALHFDYPQIELVWCYKESKYSLRDIEKNGKELILYMKYHGSSNLIRKTLQNIETKTEKIVEYCLQNGNIPDDEMVRRLCRYIVENYCYTENKGEGKYPEYAYTLECLVHGDGVCAGFAKVLTYILRKLQIPVMTVSGKANGKYFSGHAWNIVQRSDGTYWHIDLTWDLGCQMGWHKYFELDDGAMRARRHYWNGQEYPMCG